jgi:hypothetical protein
MTVRRALAIALGGLASLPSVAAADTSFPAAARQLAAYQQLLVWSPWTGPGRLMAGFGPAAAPLPIPTGRFPSIDLGADARGRPVLVYTTCAGHPRRCALNVYDFATSHHRRLSELSRPGCSDGSAQISRGAIVFGRDCRDSSGRKLDRWYLKRPGKQLRRLRGLPAGTFKPLELPALGRFDLAGNRLAFIAQRESAGPEEGDSWLTTEVRVIKLGQRHSQLLARARQLRSRVDSGTYLQNVTVDSGFAYWERVVFDGNGSSRQQIVRRPIDGSQPATRLDRAGRLYIGRYGDNLGTYAVSGDLLYYSLPAIATGSTAFIAQVPGTPVFR